MEERLDELVRKQRGRLPNFGDAMWIPVDFTLSIRPERELLTSTFTFRGHPTCLVG